MPPNMQHCNIVYVQKLFANTPVRNQRIGPAKYTVARKFGHGLRIRWYTFNVSHSPTTHWNRRPFSKLLGVWIIAQMTFNGFCNEKPFYSDGQ